MDCFWFGFRWVCSRLIFASALVAVQNRTIGHLTCYWSGFSYPRIYLTSLCRQRSNKNSEYNGEYSFTSCMFILFWRKKNEPRKALVYENSANRYSNTLISANSSLRSSNMLHSCILEREGFQRPLNFQGRRAERSADLLSACEVNFHSSPIYYFTMITFRDALYCPLLTFTR